LPIHDPNMAAYYPGRDANHGEHANE